jgi:hypothetical protein
MRRESGGMHTMQDLMTRNPITLSFHDSRREYSHAVIVVVLFFFSRHFTISSSQGIGSEGFSCKIGLVSRENSQNDNIHFF